MTMCMNSLLLNDLKLAGTRTVLPVSQLELTRINRLSQLDVAFFVDGLPFASTMPCTWSNF